MPCPLRELPFAEPKIDHSFVKNGASILLAPPMPKGRFIQLLDSRNNKARASQPESSVQRGRVA